MSKTSDRYIQSKQYEEDCHRIFKEFCSIAKSDTILTSGYGTENKIRGISGYKHQIDVSIEGETSEGETYLWLAECKHLKDKIETGDCLVFIARMMEIASTHSRKTVKGFMLTTVGYESGVEVLAHHYNINLNIVKPGGLEAMLHCENIYSSGAAASMGFSASCSETYIPYQKP